MHTLTTRRADSLRRESQLLRTHMAASLTAAPYLQSFEVCMRLPFARGSGVRDNYQALRNLFVLALLFLLVGLTGGLKAEAGDIQRGMVTSGGPGSQFAIADFDGDKRPDLASIQAEPNSSGIITYWIQLQLSISGRQSVRLLAPAGGLLVEARDVNGDNAVDLIFATAWLRQPVAVFLNDGHGNFSRTEPTAFPDAFRQTNTNWVSASNEVTDAVGSLPQSRSSFYSQNQALLHGQSPIGSSAFSSLVLLVNPFLISHAGRAPPSELPHS